MGIDISRQITKCEKCNHGRWADDLTPCKGCYPPPDPRAEVIARIQASFDRHLERDRIKSSEASKKARATVKGRASKAKKAPLYPRYYDETGKPVWSKVKVRNVLWEKKKQPNIAGLKFRSNYYNS